MPTVKKKNDGRAGIERLLRENPPSSDPCHEGQENAALVPRVYGQYEKHSIFDLVHCTAAKMYGVLPKPAVDNRMIDKITYGDLMDDRNPKTLSLNQNVHRDSQGKI